MVVSGVQQKRMNAVDNGILLHVVAVGYAVHGELVNFPEHRNHKTERKPEHKTAEKLFIVFRLAHKHFNDRKASRRENHSPQEVHYVVPAADIGVNVVARADKAAEQPEHYKRNAQPRRFLAGEILQNIKQRNDRRINKRIAAVAGAPAYGKIYYRRKAKRQIKHHNRCYGGSGFQLLFKIFAERLTLA